MMIRRNCRKCGAQFNQPKLAARLWVFCPSCYLLWEQELREKGERRARRDEQARQVLKRRRLAVQQRLLVSHAVSVRDEQEQARRERLWAAQAEQETAARAARTQEQRRRDEARLQTVDARRRERAAREMERAATREWPKREKRKPDGLQVIARGLAAALDCPITTAAALINRRLVDPEDPASVDAARRACETVNRVLVGRRASDYYRALENRVFEVAQEAE